VTNVKHRTLKNSPLGEFFNSVLHVTTKCPELWSAINEPSPPQPSGPRGQDEDD